MTHYALHEIPAATRRARRDYAFSLVQVGLSLQLGEAMRHLMRSVNSEAIGKHDNQMSFEKLVYDDQIIFLVKLEALIQSRYMELQDGRNHLPKTSPRYR